MPTVVSIHVTLAAADGRSTQGEAQLQTWEIKDATRKALQWGGAVFCIGIMMIPIPGVHFFTPFVLLIGAPLTAFMIFRLYKSGTDVAGTGECPHCQKKVALSGNAERWPLARNCSECRQSFQIERTT